MVKDCHLCSKQSTAQPVLPIIQPNLPSRPWEKLRTDIFDFNGKKHLTIVYYYSRYPVIRFDRTRLNSQWLAEYGRPTSITTDFGLQYVSEKVKIKCKQSGMTLTFSSPYHHQANSLAEREIGNCKSSLTKAMESEECPFTALWMFRTTPLDRQLPSPYQLLFGRKPSR